jgi:hypothetical protein
MSRFGFDETLADLKNQSQGLVTGVPLCGAFADIDGLKKQTDHDRRGRSPARMKMAARRAPESGPRNVLIPNGRILKFEAVRQVPRTR